MRTIVRLCLLGLALAAWKFGVWAVEPPAPRTTGKVLVLDNGNILEGNIQLCGEQYRIERAVGEVWVPAGKNMRLCADWQEAFSIMAAQANLLDPDEHMRLARWCQLHNLRELALAEVTTVLQFRPGNQEARLMKTNLERILAEQKASANVPSTVPAKAKPQMKMDISSASVALFATRVQPILMNTCVSCHSNGKGGNFQLVRACEGGQRVATQRNLAAVMEQIDVHRPNISPLLTRSVSPHGVNKLAPIKSHSEAYDSLANWVDQLLADNPHLRAEREPTELARVPTPEARVVTSIPAFKTDIEQARAVPSYVSETKPVAQDLATRPLPKFTTPPSQDPVRDNQSSGKADVVTTKHTWSVENKSAPLQPAPEIVQTTFSDHGSPAAVAEPVDEFDPAFFNQQTEKAATGAEPGR